MATNQTEDEKAQPIIVKKVIKKGGGHHGGAWKVAYADFVTAMMAFFLLMWLLNVTTAEEKFAISNFFDPTFPKVSSTESGAGGVLGGTTVSPDGAMTSTVQPIAQPDIPDTTKQGGDNENSVIQKPESSADVDTSEERAREIIKEAEERRFKDVENQIRQAVESNAELKALTNNLIIDMTEEGLRIQIVDQDNNAMFPSGSARMYEKTRDLLKLVSTAIRKLSNPISVRGHTDAAPYPKGNNYDNWELSADRANASRRALIEGDTPPSRIANVLGKAATDPIDAGNPLAPINRRISIILLREQPSEEEIKKVQKRAQARAKLRAEQLEKEEAEAERKRIEEERNRPFRSGGGVLGLE